MALGLFSAEAILGLTDSPSAMRTHSNEIGFECQALNTKRPKDWRMECHATGTRFGASSRLNRRFCRTRASRIIVTTMGCQCVKVVGDLGSRDTRHIHFDENLGGMLRQGVITKGTKGRHDSMFCRASQTKNKTSGVVPSSRLSQSRRAWKKPYHSSHSPNIELGVVQRGRIFSSITHLHLLKIDCKAGSKHVNAPHECDDW